MTNNEITEQIENIRNMMITVGLSKGLTSIETIELSIELDNLLNLQMRI